MIIRSPFARPGGLRTALRAFSREEKLYTMMRILLFLATNLAVLVIASITLKLLGVDRFTGQNYGSLLVFCAVFGFAGSLVSLFISKWMAKMSTGTEVISQPRTRHEQWLLQTVEELSREAGIKMPEVGIFPAYEANAFATGWNKNDALVAVSQGLLERFSPDEVKAVLAHEIGHVANGDMVTLALIQGVVNTFVMFFARIFGNFVDKAILKNEDGPGIGYFVATIFAELVLADEINRATPKSQSALLEAMEEGQVTIEGATRPLPEPFFVIATQNPASQGGTFSLPESQLDRFLMRLSLGYPGRAAERSLLLGEARRDLLPRLEPLLDHAALAAFQAEVPKVRASDALVDYVLRLVDGVPAALYPQRTGQPLAAIADACAAARDAGLLADDPQRLRPSERGQLFLNDLLQHFLP